RRRMTSLRAALGAVVAVTLALAASTLVLLASGARPVPALLALVAGAAGDRYAIVETLLKTCPLLITGLAVAITFRCGVWNIGAEGQFLLGALAATTAAQAAASAPRPL